MRFEYDQIKSLQNEAKHGISLEQAKVLWDNDAVILPAKTQGEPRSMIIGWIAERLYSCIFTVRHGNMRLISCRRSSAEERGLYHEKVDT